MVVRISWDDLRASFPPHHRLGHHLMLLPTCDPISLPPSSLRVVSFLLLSPSTPCPSGGTEPPAAAPSMPSGNTNLLTCICSRSQHACTERVRPEAAVQELSERDSGSYFPRQVLIPGRVLAADAKGLVVCWGGDFRAKGCRVPVAVIKASIQSLAEFHGGAGKFWHSA